MSKLKILVENSFWIVVDNGIFIRNPIKEDLIGAQVRKIHILNIEGELEFDEIADIFGVTEGNIYLICCGKTWNHIYREFFPKVI